MTRSTPIDMTHTNIQLPFIKSFIIKTNSLDQCLNLGVRFNNVNSATYNVTFWTWGTTQIFYAEYYSITFD